MPSAATTPPRSSSPELPWLAGLPAGRDLSRDELWALARTLGREEAAWRAHVRHDPRKRHYVQLHRDPHLDVWLICWINEQETGLHDHDVSAGAVHVCRGDLVEDCLELRNRTLHRVSVVRPRGATFDFDSSHVHCVRHAPSAGPAVSIHVYSPALWRMGYYEIGHDGLLRRTSVSYAEETLAA